MNDMGEGRVRDMMATLLANKQPVLVTDNEGKKELLPLPDLFNNFELLHYFLDEVLEDWKRASTPYQSKIDSLAGDSEFSASSAFAFVELQPIFLKCVFSYAMFFVSTESVYEIFYSELNRANKISGLSLKHEKPPRRSSTVKKLKMVRNWSIVHIASEKTEEIDRLSAMSWQPLSWRKGIEEKWDVNQMEFGAFRRIRRTPDGKVIAKSKDIKLPRLPLLHQECMRYLERYDKLCSEYLHALHNSLDSS